MGVFRDSFTLVEVIVSVALFGMLTATVLSSLVGAQQSWTEQQVNADILQEARWALQLMSNELRYGDEDDITIEWDGSRISFDRDTNANEWADLRVWFWRNRTGWWPNYNYYEQFYRGDDSLIFGFTRFEDAENDRQELALRAVSNPEDELIFAHDGNGLITIELTMRLNPDEDEGPGNRELTLRTKVRTRNW